MTRHANQRRSPRLHVEVLEDRCTPTVLPTGFTETLLTAGLTAPSAMEFAPDGRIFVAEQAGQLRVVKNGALLPAPFASLNVDSSGERGLLGIAFDPAFATNRFVYVYYTTPSGSVHNRVSRFTANGDVAAPGSEVVLLELDNLSSATNHNGGAIHFGPDGKLYVAVGDNANGNNSQAFTTRHGKMLRINTDGSIPADNPFVATTSGLNEAIWAIGLRNPFTFAFQPGSTRMFINDVGQATWEEINDGLPAGNYGWALTEGPTTDPRFRSPLFAYQHGDGNDRGCAITGGAFYNPATLTFPADYTGDYFFADFCNGWIRRYDSASGAVSDFATGTAPFVVDLKVDGGGSLYYLARGFSSDAAIYRIDFPAVQAPPRIDRQPASLFVSLGQSATFTVSASGLGPLTYQWQRNRASIPGATGPSYTQSTTTLADNGSLFRVVVSNPFGGTTSAEAALSVTNDQPPTGSITTPIAASLYVAGTTIAYSGTATDAEDGTLPPSAFTWRVDFHHADHAHPFLAPVTGTRSGSFTIPTTGETAADVFYRLTLTVRDSSGLAHVSQRDVLPRTATINLATNPAGLLLRLDGQPTPTPAALTGVAGIQRTLGVVNPQDLSGVFYEFVSWSDGGGTQHDISTPQTNTTYTATFRRIVFPNDNALFLGGAYHDLLDRPLDTVGRSVFEPGLNLGRFRIMGQVAVDFVTSTENRTNLIHAAYATFLGRGASPGEVAGWLQPLRQGTSPDQVLAAIHASLESFQRRGSDNGRWLDQLYRDFLGRGRDPGSQGLLDALNQGTARDAVALAITASPEYRTRLVRGGYLSYLGREPGAGEVVPWLALLNGPNPGTNQPSPRERFFAGVLASEEFFQKQGGTNRAWVEAVYLRLLNRPADMDGLLLAVLRILNDYAAVRQTTAAQIAVSDEARGRFVTGAYQTLLGRAVNDNERAFWVGVLRQGTPREQVEAAIVSSPEYFQRHGGTNTAWLDQVYVDLLGRRRDATETVFLTALNGGTQTRAQVAAGIAGSVEFRRTLIQNFYARFLERVGSGGEVDFWAQAFGQGTRFEQIAASILSSIEYYLRPHLYP